MQPVQPVQPMQLHRFFLRNLYLPITLALLLLGGVWWGVWQATRLIERQSQLQKQLERTQIVLAEVLNLETGVRGYLLTGDLSFLEPFRQARGQVLDRLTQLEEGLPASSKPLELPRLEQVRGLLSRWFTEVAEVQIGNVLLRGERGVGNADPLSRQGKALIDAIRARLGEYRQTVEKSRTTTEGQQRQTLDLLVGIVIISSLAAILAALWISLRVAGQLSSVFSRLEAATRKLAQGQIQAVPASPLLEVDSLAQSFNSMSEQLIVSRRTLEEYNLTLERSARFERTLADVLELYTDGSEVSDIATRLLELVGKRHGARFGAAYGFIGGDGLLYLRGVFNPHNEIPQTLDPKTGQVGRALLERRVVWLEDEREQPEDTDERERLESESGLHSVLLPIALETQIFGVVLLNFPLPPDPLLEGFLNSLTLQVSIASAKLSAEIQRRQLTAQLQEYTVKLEVQSMELEQRGSEMEHKNQALERSDRLKTEFLANMSHELRTPLNALLGFSDLLEEQFFGPLNERQVGYVREISQAGSHLLGLINDVLDLSKIEAGVVLLERTPLVLAPLLESYLSLVKERAHDKNIRLERVLETRPETQFEYRSVWADERKLKQVLVNLLSNAVKFTPEGGVVTLEARMTQVGTSESLYLAVIDNGIGIALEDQARLFQSFTQVDGSLSRRHEGTGLGLALVRSLVSLHGGEVGVSSKPGEGSTFWLTLPQRSERQDSSVVRPTDAPLESNPSNALPANPLNYLEDTA